MKNKKSLLLFLLIIGGLSVTAGLTFAFFNYSRLGSSSEIVTGDIYLNFIDDGASGITLENEF